MDDEQITELFWARAPQALNELQKKYGKYVLAISNAILHDEQDAQECANDTYFAVWNSIPPQKPKILKAFVASIARHKSLKRYESNIAKKRNDKTVMLLDEYAECMPDGYEDPADSIALKEAINDFLDQIGKIERFIFMRRYFYASPISEIAKMCGMTENNTSVVLHRTREKLKTFLRREGFSIE